ncbi:hypothetical protein ACTS95_10310 [Empedobacter brevis]
MKNVFILLFLQLSSHCLDGKILNEFTQSKEVEYFNSKQFIFIENGYLDYFENVKQQKAIVVISKDKVNDKKYFEIYKITKEKDNVKKVFIRYQHLNAYFILECTPDSLLNIESGQS